jgi:hypothetical protein
LKVTKIRNFLAMKKEKLIIELSNNIDLIKTHINRLKKSTYNVNPLDVDLLKQKTIEFYGHLFDLEKTINIANIDPEKIVVAKPSVEQPPILEIKGEDKKEVIPELIDEIKLAENELVEDKEKKENEDDVFIIDPDIVPQPTHKSEQIEQEQPSVIEKPIPDLEIEENLPEQLKENSLPPQTTYDLFSGSSENALAEKFQSIEEQSLADKMLHSSITNIREAIGINEKFLFINELFNGDLSRYNKILDDINELTTKKGVDTYLLELKIQFQWADENDAYIKLRELLDRKFS